MTSALLAWICLLLALGLPLDSRAQQKIPPGTIQLKGRIISARDHKPLAGATVRLLGSSLGTRTDPDGQFRIRVDSGKVRLLVSFIGYTSRELSATIPRKQGLDILLYPAAHILSGMVVSTGYQQIPRERATGSFTLLGKRLLNRSVSTDILSRLNGVASGFTFNYGKGNASNPYNIRGTSTLFANPNPLIILDNFPFDGDPNDINPDDVQSITLLKDAAAASIWGAQAGNGVIVITTKKGLLNSPLRVSFHSSITLGERPDLFSLPTLSTPDFIQVEQQLFAEGFYDYAQSSYDHEPLTPVVSLLYDEKAGLISTQQANQQISQYKTMDVRRDFENYFYQPSLNQQYAVNLSGGGNQDRYYFSVGYDHNRSNEVRNGYGRVSLDASNTYELVPGKLNISAHLFYTMSQTTNNNPGYGGIDMNYYTPLYPYAQLADAQGHPLPIVHDYQGSFIQSAQQQGLLDWSYSPLEELRLSDNRTQLQDMHIQSRIAYHILPGLSAEALYQFQSSFAYGRNFHSPQSYFTRNLINQYTQVDALGNLSYPIPLGGILDRSNLIQNEQNFRAQLNYNHDWKGQGSLGALIGAEVKDLHTYGDATRYYGYNNDLATVMPVDYNTQFALYNNPYNAQQIPFEDNLSDQTDRFISYFTNAAYTFRGRYTASLSARVDQSNLFGVSANQRSVPLWSTGLAWNLSQEPFFHHRWFDLLKLRATYGYSGNIDKSLSSYVTAQSSFQTSIFSHLPYSNIINPPNSELRWERIGMLNLGLDFETVHRILYGSLEYYVKRGLDLIGQAPLPPSSGFSQFTGNTADSRGHGIDLELHTRNLNRTLKWTTGFLFNFVLDKVSRYLVPGSANDYLEFGDGQAIIPMVGRPLYSLYSYAWAGLDPQTGDPEIIYQGKPSEDYAGIAGNTTPDQLVYNGPARPPYFGSLMNSFRWKGLSLSFNILYRLGYYFRKPSILYASLLNGLGGNPDYDLRWQKPGDEKFTSVPSQPSYPDPNRDQVYAFSSVLVKRADNIRFQDIRLSYDLRPSRGQKFPVRLIRFYVYINNIGILWKAYHGSLDPDFPGLKPTRSYSGGVQVNF